MWLFLQCLLSTPGSSPHFLFPELGLPLPCFVRLSSMLGLEVINEQQGPLAVCSQPVKPWGKGQKRVPQSYPKGAVSWEEVGVSWGLGREDREVSE